MDDILCYTLCPHTTNTYACEDFGDVSAFDHYGDRIAGTLGQFQLLAMQTFASQPQFAANYIQYGRITELFPDEDHGTITTPDVREVYFHKNSVLNALFDQLETGTEVRFEEEQGDRGPQASTVRLSASTILLDKSTAPPAC